jgi:hypothetical protein
MAVAKAFLALVLSFFGAAPSPPAAETPPPGEITAWMQQRLDRGHASIFLPRLLGGQCYRTRGLWVSRDDTTIDSNGACLVAMAPGPVRLTSGDGDPIAADAVLFVNRSSHSDRAPSRVRISNLRIVVPAAVTMFGIEIYGHRVELDHVTVEGAPTDAVLVGGRANGDGWASNVSIHDSTFTGGRRNVISITSVRGISVTRSLIMGASDTNLLHETGRASGNPSAGIDVEPDNPADPIVGVRISGNRILANAGPGVILALHPGGQPAQEADGIVITYNLIAGNGLKPTPPIQGGIVVAGGQANGNGHLLVTHNQIVRNAVFGLGSTFGGTTLIVDAHDNRIEANRGGDVSFTEVGRGSWIR